MKITITNKELFFAIESVWSQLDYRLKAQINELVTTNDTDDFEQEINIDAESFIMVMNAVSNQPQGIAKDINPPMHLKLKVQILTAATPIFQYLATLTDEIEIADYKEANKEIITIATEIQAILAKNLVMLDAKLLNGKTQILN